MRSIEPLPAGLTMDFLRASSYTGSTTTGQDAVSLGMVSKTSVQGRHVLLVEDIIDTGKTLQARWPALLWLPAPSATVGDSISGTDGRPHGAGAVRAAASAGRSQRGCHCAFGQGGAPHGGPRARLQGLRGEGTTSCAPGKPCIYVRTCMRPACTWRLLLLHKLCCAAWQTLKKSTGFGKSSFL